MKILHLLYESRGDYFGIGGVGERAYNIYAHLKERNDITLVCRKYPGARDGEIEGLRHIFAGTESKNFTKTLLSYARHSALFVKRHGAGFDVIVEEFSPAIPTFLNLYTKRPLVLQMQGYTGRKYFEKYNIIYSATLYFFEKYRPAGYKNIIVVSDASRKRFNFKRGQNVQVISNGISEKILNIEPSESDYLLYLGRIDIHHKGLDILINAYKEFFRQHRDIRLVVAGHGRDMEKFKGMLDTLPGDLRKNVELTGWVEGEKKGLLFKNAIAVVIPSRYETQGIVAMEAMAYGKPVISSDIPGLTYVTACGAGLAFRAEDALSLAQVMKDCIRGSGRVLMGRSGREWVKEYTWEKVALKYEEFLMEVCAR